MTYAVIEKCGEGSAGEVQDIKEEIAVGSRRLPQILECLDWAGSVVIKLS